MRNPRSEQNHFFELVQGRLESEELIVDKVAEILHLSRDSAYRRIRGITDLSVREMAILARYYGIGLNKLIGEHENAVVFHRRPFIKSLDDFKNHLIGELQELENISSYSDHHVCIQAKDIPVFHLFRFPKLAAFQLYIWLKSVYDFSKIEGLHYDLSRVPQELVELAQQQHEAYNKLNCTEIWNDTTILSLINQIEYHYEAGLLSSKEEAINLCEEMHKMMKIIYHQALQGKKLTKIKDKEFGSTNFKMHYHEILLADNHILAEFNRNQRRYFIPYAGINTLKTGDPIFNRNIHDHLKALTKKSSLISDISEKERNKFFIRIKNRIDRLKSRIEKTDPFM
tara:strand:- start:16524 stop:17546 length:1023 start_codon:yes stop_codon:yes gene_type:complete